MPGRLDRLSDALHHQHVVLGGILRRLSDVGLRPEQLARLAGLPIDEVLGLLLEPAEAHRRR